MSNLEPWQICIDTGGTFTDCWALAPGLETPILVKVLSSGKLRVRVVEWISSRCVRVEIPENWRTPDGFFTGYSLETGKVSASKGALLELDSDQTKLDSIDLFTGEEAPVVGARLLTGTSLANAFPELRLRLATTRGTNALLEGKGAPLAFFVTRGFGDLLTICDQRRPDLFALNHRKPDPLYDLVVEIDERLDAEGRVLKPIVIPENLSKLGVKVAAVALMHSYANPEHEQQLLVALREAGFENISLSSELAPLIKLLPRAETAVVDAYLTPVMSTFLDRVQSAAGANVLVMTSAGGLEGRSAFHPKDSLFSGPAGGVVGAAAAGRACGFDQLITFDMGGTSTDVARFDRDFAYQFQQRAGAATLLSPSLRIETVAAGGGSICRRTEAGLRVGPESAGADPGPACYGRGGPLTITDVNLLLGRIDPDNFGIPLGEENLKAARERLRELADDEDETRFLEGLLEIAVEQMAASIRTISIREGADPADYALLAFGGAGPLHACAIAEKLGMKHIVVPAEAGVLSAFGLHQARVERFAERQVLRELSECQGELSGVLSELGSQASQQLLVDLPVGSETRVRRQIAELRLLGQDSALTLDLVELVGLAEAFRDRYEEVFGYRPETSQAIEVVSLRVIAADVAQSARIPKAESLGSGVEILANSASFLDRSKLEPGAEIHGSAIIQDPFSTLYLKPGWGAVCRSNGAIVCDQTATDKNESAVLNEGVVRELFRNRFENIVNEMGAMLQRSAISTNVKERLDFSCALLDREGQLVVNAPHIPVHLGALGLCVREVVRVLDLKPEDMAITNHPGFGGSHLPDVTVISPVFDPQTQQLLGYVANRAHHAELGGIRPGSMPPNARNLAEEGVVIAPMLLFSGGQARYDEIERILTEPPFPTRNLRDNLADLQAQAASNLRGVEALHDLAAEHGSEVLQSQLDSLAEQSRQSFREALQAKPLACESVGERLDDGSPIRVSALRDGERFILDFAGTADVLPTNLNATPAIVRSAILYCLRLWTGSELPLNEGLLRDVEILLPPSFLNPEFPADPKNCPAVVGGNVETSQRVVDAVLRLFGIQACSQGTMNNFIFGDETFGYYETIAGGAGAGPGYAGASGLHTHMTNTAITDPEILEKRYPVLLRQFALRQGSGGAGEFPGGNGVVREFEFLKPLEISLLTQHRVELPYGMSGGSPGTPGQQLLIRKNGETEPIGGHAAIDVEAGDRVRIETPGGGGWGSS
ncbi:MAG: 5-oxoprolinase (ATP-hydrolyzing) [Verrucomicrobiales bacterium]